MARRLPHLQGKGAQINNLNQNEDNHLAQQNQQINQQQQLQQQQQQQQYQQQQQQQAYHQQQQQYPPNNTQQYNQNQQQTPQNQGQYQAGQQYPQLKKKQGSSKIDTDQIPRPVIDRLESNKFIEYNTTSGAQIPYSNNFYSTVDTGNAGPRHIRVSLNTIPTEPSHITSTQIPFGVVVTPLSDPGPTEFEIIKIDQREGQIQRCARCKAYYNPYFKLVDNGAFVMCNLCKMKMPVPQEYFHSLSQSIDQRTDKAELKNGIYEYWTNPEYNPRPVKAISIMLALEISPASLLSGVFQSAIQSIQMTVDNLPAPETTEIAIITYDQQLNFYKIPQDLNNEMHISIVNDLDEPYSPYPKNMLFLNAANDKEKIYYLLEKLLSIGNQMLTFYQNQKIQFKVSASLGSVVKACQNAMASAIGKIIVFASQLPALGFGKLKIREDAKVVNTALEKTFYVPQNNVYTTLAQELLKQQLAVDLFIFNPNYMDLATVSALSTVTGGQLHYFPNYDINTDGEKVHYSLYRALTKTQGYDAIMTIRTSPGIILEDYYTGAGKIAVRDLELATIDSDSTLGIMLKVEEKVADPYLQFAILYTNQCAQRVVRVINLQISAVQNNYQSVFKSCDLECIFNLMARKHIANLPNLSINQIKEQLTNQLVGILHSYRKECAQSSSTGQLILPESLKMLPLYVNSLLKKNLLQGTALVKTDERVADFIRFSTQNVHKVANWIYPKIYPLHDIYEKSEQDEITPGSPNSNQLIILPTSIPATIEKLDSNGLYAIDDSDTIYLFIGRDLSPDILLHLFETSDLEQISQFTSIPELDVDFNQRVVAIINQIKNYKQGIYQLTKICIQGDRIEQHIGKCLVEDSINNERSYSDYLVEVHKLINLK